MHMTNNLLEQDKQHRQRALNPRESFIVQAPAGSGKTELIIQRLLTLLSLVNKPEEILAITFTKKSAHEMRVRIVKALENAKYNPKPEKAHEQLTWDLANKVLARDKQFNWNLIENPNQLAIKTIDSFCHYLTSQLPLLSHFGSQPDIAIHPAPLYRETVLEVLSHVEQNQEWSAAVAKLFMHCDNDLNKLMKLLVELLQKRDQWQGYLLDTNNDEIRDILQNHIAAVIQDNLENFASEFPDDICEELFSLCRFVGNCALSHNPENSVTLLHDIAELPGTDASDLPTWQALARFLLTKKNEWRKSAHKDAGWPVMTNFNKEEKAEQKEPRNHYKELLAQLAENTELLTGFTNIVKLPDMQYSDEQWGTLKALLEVLKILSAQLRVTFEAHGEIDFIENAKAARDALGEASNPTDLALSLDYQIKHILIDEFQDTSFTQYSLLEKLTYGWQPDDGRTLFVVGDPMQSIYRFRLAEVGLFIRMQQHGIGDLNLVPLTLSVNFRSAKQIVEWNNHHFSNIFPAHSDIGSGAVHYSHSIANGDDDAEANIRINGFLAPRQDQQAKAIVDLIRQTEAHYPSENIAILVRSRSHLNTIIPALKQAGIKFNALEIDALIARQSIQDLIALTRALLHAADRVAWLAVLRAPWCGLTLEDLHKVAGLDRKRMLWECLTDNEVTQTLSRDGQDRLNKVIPVLKLAIENRQRQNLRLWVESTWQALGGPATLSSSDDLEDANQYFSLLDELHNEGREISLQSLNDAVTSLFATTSHDDSRVQIMTIHSSKGLEFDTVILPHLEKTSPADSKALLSWMEYPLQDDNTALLLAPLHAAGDDSDKLYAYIQYLQGIKAEYETQRLFYVATTRAKKRLFCYFDSKDIEKNESSNTFLGRLWPLIKNQPDLFAQQEENGKQDSEQRQPFFISRLSAEWTCPVQEVNYADHSTHQNQSGFKLDDDTPRLTGTVTHSILQSIANNGVDWWTQQATDSKSQYVQRLLRQNGLTDTDGNITSTIIEMLDKTVNDEKGSWIVSPHEEAESELRLSYVTADGVEDISIDRTFIDNGVRWIIDYKTAGTDNENLEAFLKKQRTQYNKQMQKYKTAISQIDHRPIKLGLYFPAISAWCEW
jgi:ATP-dependent helicase/nuclease subunit A